MEKKSEKKGADPNIGDIKRCIVPSQNDWAYDYYNRQMSEDQEQEFEDHLFECDWCQDILLMLDWAYTELRLNAHQYASSQAKAGKSKLSMKAKSNKG